MAVYNDAVVSCMGRHSDLSAATFYGKTPGVKLPCWDLCVCVCVCVCRRRTLFRLPQPSFASYVSDPYHIILCLTVSLLKVLLLNASF